METLPSQEGMVHIWNFWKNFRWHILLISVLGIGISLSETIGVTMVIPLLEGVGNFKSLPLPFPLNQISAVFSGIGLRERVQIVALFMVLIVAFKGSLTYASSLLTNHLQQGTVKYYRMLCFEQLMRIKMGHFNVQRFGHIQSLVVTSASYVGALICDTAFIIPKVFTLIFLLSLLIIISWKLTLVAIILVMLATFTLRKISLRSALAGQAADEALRDMNSTLLDTLAGMKIIRLFNREKDMTCKFDDDAQNCNDTVFALNKAKVLVGPLFEFVGITSLALMMIAGSFFMGKYGDAALQMLLVFLYIFLRLIPSANAFNNLRVGLAGHWPFFNRVLCFIEQKDSIYVKDGSQNFSGLKQSIGFNKVDFAYGPEEPVVLRNVSFSIPKGAKVGIVGPSGAGKSTITELLLRFYDPIKGGLLIDGVDLRNFNINSWRKHIGVVTQDTFLFNDTVLANIAFAKPMASQKEIEVAVKRAHAFKFIQELPQGFNTMLGERGVRLSGGQRQRIAIARAILCEPEILIFDEATSALDTEAERIVQEALDDVAQGKTVIAIAHRLSTVSDSDIILVFSDGLLVQQGRHQELLGRDGIYKRLVQLQSL